MTKASGEVFVTHIKESLGDDCQVDLIVTDLKKAFDTVDGLDMLGMGDPLLSRFKPNLNHRKQFVNVYGLWRAFSDLPSNSLGIPKVVI